jgi:hypothetical protein
VGLGKPVKERERIIQHARGSPPRGLAAPDL